MKKNGKSVNHIFHTAAMLPTAVLSIGLTMPAPSAHATIAQPEEIIVTARRTEEVLQNVPISMTVFNQDMLSERNVSSGADLATYTPSLSVNTRFGSDQTTFAIRGFTQELRTTASVAVYFADVVAPRGGGSVTSGDGAGPGSFFDLQNVQVLKGPQGTLFGRNTTGGAIQLTPEEPKDSLGGYIELSKGTYNMHRQQGVLNLPITDDLRARFGFDAEKRDGYLKNISDIGPAHLGNINYLSGRGSVMWNITPSVSNYTIYTYTTSNNRGSIQNIYACDANGQTGFLCAPSFAKNKDFYDVQSDTADPRSEMRQQQLINHTTWDVNDNFSIKNILSYANLLQNTRGSTFGGNFSIGGTHLWLFPAGSYQGLPTNSQKTYIEELRFSGTSMGGGLTWQTGLYYERSRPDATSGSLSPSYAECGPQTGDPRTMTCNQFFPGGGVGGTVGTVEYINKAAYAQTSYDISDEFRVTLGLRYTVDRTNATSFLQSYNYNTTPNPVTIDGQVIPPGGYTGFNCTLLGASAANGCEYHQHQNSEAPTWLIDFDYLPTPDVLVYTKYARGYRQGSVNYGAPAGAQVFGPEKVDAYEIGTKNTFRGFISGTFNIAAFYNELSNQQLQVGAVPCGLAQLQNPNVVCNSGGFAGAATTAIVNAGSSTIQGVEVETTLKLTEGLLYTLSYTYLQTRLNSLDVPPAPTGYISVPAAVEGGHLSFSPTNSLTTGLSYTLPIPAELGSVSLGGTYSYVSDQISSVGTLGNLAPRRLVSATLGWKSIAGSPLDLNLFATNLLNEKYESYTPGLYDQLGMDFHVVGEPRMYGAALKYHFGN